MNWFIESCAGAYTRRARRRPVRISGQSPLRVLRTESAVLHPEAPRVLPPSTSIAR